MLYLLEVCFHINLVLLLGRGQSFDEHDLFLGHTDPLGQFLFQLGPHAQTSSQMHRIDLDLSLDQLYLVHTQVSLLNLSLQIL